jgi:hypothetical protein
MLYVLLDGRRRKERKRKKREGNGQSFVPRVGPTLLAVLRFLAVRRN